MNQSFSSNADEPAKNMARPPAGIYIHVPFCRAKCPYCDFYSITDPGSISDYIEALLVELTLYRQAGVYADSIYFGGGTPSVLAPRQVARVMDGIHACFSVAPEAETTLEVNPETVDQRKLARYREAGINRLNIGLQSLDDHSLIFWAGSIRPKKASILITGPGRPVLTISGWT
jgi:oxygen-independent coproporphyrinogen-3 oxidase